MNRWQYATLAVLVPVVVVGALSLGRWLADDGASDSVGLASAADETTFEYDFLIPSGTAARIDAGETVELVPAVLEVRVGEAIRIVNEDDEGHVVGVFYVGAGETLTKRFTSPGELSGACELHSDGEFTVRVSA